MCPESLIHPSLPLMFRALKLGMCFPTRFAAVPSFTDLKVDWRNIIFFYYYTEVNEHSAQALAEAAADKLNKMCEQLNLLGNRKKRGRPTSFNVRLFIGVIIH